MMLAKIEAQRQSPFRPETAFRLALRAKTRRQDVISPATMNATHRAGTNGTDLVGCGRVGHFAG
jgi:hypothetical protein